MLLEAETNKYCPGANDIGAISNLITWVLNFFLSAVDWGYKTNDPKQTGRWNIVISIQFTNLRSKKKFGLTIYSVPKTRVWYEVATSHIHNHQPTGSS